MTGSRKLPCRVAIAWSAARSKASVTPARTSSATTTKPARDVAATMASLERAPSSFSSDIRGVDHATARVAGGSAAPRAESTC